ncbi:MAG: hypothetical protein KUG67_00650 [Proteobacteria bacterium]|nr:hypothetical protein [Pseudomonadota bacterium]
MNFRLIIVTVVSLLISVLAGVWFFSQLFLELPIVNMGHSISLSALRSLLLALSSWLIIASTWFAGMTLREWSKLQSVSWLTTAPFTYLLCRSSGMPFQDCITHLSGIVILVFFWTLLLQYLLPLIKTGTAKQWSMTAIQIIPLFLLWRYQGLILP